MLRQLPAALLGNVCAMLPVREAVLALAFVARRSDVRVPWTRLVVGAEPFLRYACLACLVNFEATLQTKSVAWVNGVLVAAPSLRRLSLFVVDTLLLLSLEQALGVRELALSLKHAQMATSEPLVRFLAAFPRLGQLALEFSIFYASAILGWLVEALSSLKPGCLRSLDLEGGIYLQNQGIERTIAECQPSLKELRLDLRGSKNPGACLDTLLGLEACRVTANDWSDVKFIERLPNLRVLSVSVLSDPVGELRLPQTLTEFSSDCYHFPHVAWSTGLEVLKVSVDERSLTQLFALLPELQRLRSLSVKFTVKFASGKRQAWSRLTKQLIEQPGFVCANVRHLVLRDFVTYVGLLAAFPGLRELELQLYEWRTTQDRDLELSSVFGSRPELQTIKDTQLESTVMVSRREDGRLVRREASSTRLLRI
jgi:hypothetical protein